MAKGMEEWEEERRDVGKKERNGQTPPPHPSINHTNPFGKAPVGRGLLGKNGKEKDRKESSWLMRERKGGGGQSHLVPSNGRQ